MDLGLSQAIRLKGMAGPDQLAAATGHDEVTVADGLAALLRDGAATERNGRYRLTPDGRQRLAEALAAERDAADGPAVAALYEEFCGHNLVLKQIAHDWQLRDGAPNDHGDAAYDAAVLERLDGLHAAFDPLLRRIVTAGPDRLSPYPGRFAGALARVHDGDHSWFLKPLADSYHTVWFELHEDLLGLAGLDRVEEAAAGRAE